MTSGSNAELATHKICTDCREIGLEVMWLDALMTSISPPSHLLKIKLITVWNGRMPDGGVVRGVTTTTAVK